jgi:hypothetical protein
MRLGGQQGVPESMLDITSGSPRYYAVCNVLALGLGSFKLKEAIREPTEGIRACQGDAKIFSKSIEVSRQAHV